MEIDLGIAVAGLLVGFVVGLTGMGGGALMTPILVVVFGVQPLAAVSSDLAAAVVMKPVGGGVHLRRGTVHRGLVGWLCLGSVPAAFAGALVLEALGEGPQLQRRITIALGAALLVAASAMVAKSALRRSRGPGGQLGEIQVRVLPTVVVGVAGGLVVGMTSVGSGSLMIVLLLALYPSLKASQLVGTDLVQAIPLVGSAALGHALFGDLQWGLTASLLVGSLPGVYAGAQASSRAPDEVIRPVLVLVLVLSGLKLLGLGTGWLGLVLVAGLVTLGALAIRGLRRRRAAHRATGSSGGARDATGSAREDVPAVFVEEA